MTKTNLIFLLGLAGSGKDTVGQFLANKHNYVRVAFADALKEEVAKIENINVQALHTQGSVKELYRPKLIEYAEKKRQISPLYWLEKAFEPYRHSGLSHKGFYPNQNLVVTDCRRGAEILWVHDWKAMAKENVNVFLVIVNRPNITDKDVLTHYCLGVAEGIDRIERRFKLIDAYINNDGTLADLERKVNTLVQTLLT